MNYFLIHYSFLLFFFLFPTRFYTYSFLHTRTTETPFSPVLGSPTMAPITNGAASPKKRIAVMTSGGDSPGMNGSVRAVVRMAIDRDCEAYCVYEGYEGLVQGGDLIRKAQWEDVRGWLSEGGTLIGTARCKSFTERPGRLKAAKNMIDNGINALVICGGDGSLTGADTFRGEWPGLLEELVSVHFCQSV